MGPKAILCIHIVQSVLVVSVVSITVARLLTKEGPMARADTMALSMGAKSLVFLAYELLSEHVEMFKKWASLKANTILNCMEVVFWAAVAYLLIQSNVQSCTGLGCTLAWVIVVMAIILSLVSAFAGFVFFQEFREHKARGGGEKSSRERLVDHELGRKSTQSL